MGPTTGVYLGDGWVLTAGHAGAGTLELGGASYPAVPESRIALSGEAGSARPDLGLFRVEPRPPLPRLAIAARTPRVGASLLLVGCGVGRGERFEWDGRVGYRWQPPPVCRWGTNRVAATGLDVSQPGTSTRVFATLFSVGERREAQAAQGDSGGAVFTQGRRGRWRLAGILIAVVRHPGQPPGTTVDGNATHLADLAHYRSQILELTGLPEEPDPGRR
jgi:hypothetical protein